MGAYYYTFANCAVGKEIFKVAPFMINGIIERTSLMLLFTYWQISASDKAFRLAGIIDSIENEFKMLASNVKYWNYKLALWFPVQPQSSDNVRTSLQVPVAKPKIYSENSFIVDEQLAEDECLCEVCCDLIDTNDQGDPLMPCRHKICARCWKLHVSAKMQDSNPSPQQQVIVENPRKPFLVILALFLRYAKLFFSLQWCRNRWFHLAEWMYWKKIMSWDNLSSAPHSMCRKRAETHP